MSVIFDTILTKGVRAGQIPARTESAREWYRNSAQEYKRIDETKLMKGGNERLTSRVMVGSMYMYYYDPKHKATLPYYDRFPLVFPYKKVPGGFMGINMHYLPLNYRAKLMDALYDVSNNDKYDETTKLKFNYNILNGASKYKYFAPCVKHYLTDQVRSRFLYVYPSEWDIALFLPTQRFVGATKEKVWKDSINTVRNSS
jgi:hypothetical protein